MSAPELYTGAFIQSKKIRVIAGEDQGWYEYSALKGRQFNFLFLGGDDIKADGEKIDPIEVMKLLGWKIDPEDEKKLRDYNAS